MITEIDPTRPAPFSALATAARYAELAALDAWEGTGFRAHGFIVEPGAPAMVACGTDPEAIVWDMMLRAESCCNARTSFTATDPAASYVRGMGCDVALLSGDHQSNPGANAAIRALADYLGRGCYTYPIKGVMCLYMPLNGDVESAAWAPAGVVADVAAAVEAAR